MQALRRQRNLTHIYVDWKEIQRHTPAGGLRVQRFRDGDQGSPAGVAAGVLEPPLYPFSRPAPGGMIIPALLADQELYQIR